MDVDVKVASTTSMDKTPKYVRLPPHASVRETFRYALSDNDPLIAVTSKFPTMLTFEKANTELQKIISLAFLYGQTNILLEMNLEKDSKHIFVANT